ncbi:EF hand [Methanobrevibacter cuticularis]|uniref:EF hand n=1 Tax=Methanobrevibacter cuticularis TaxID=47311 RepID=A0A166EJH0_9EURY|nr:hypothetical protein [Methanobrevibacter cuticularis]KZX16723.1 EF hand [Methanobrevibacter cuticularis]
MDDKNFGIGLMVVLLLLGIVIFGAYVTNIGTDSSDVNMNDSIDNGSSSVDSDETNITSTDSSEKSDNAPIDTSSSSSGGTEEIFTNNVLERYDFDGDGRISRSEWNTWCSYEGYDSMSNCDTNGDGYCSRSELNTYSHKYGY